MKRRGTACRALKDKDLYLEIYIAIKQGVIQEYEIVVMAFLERSDSMQKVRTLI